MTRDTIEGYLLLVRFWRGDDLRVQVLPSQVVFDAVIVSFMLIIIAVLYVAFRPVRQLNQICGPLLIAPPQLIIPHLGSHAPLIAKLGHPQRLPLRLRLPAHILIMHDARAVIQLTQEFQGARGLFYLV